MVLNEIEVAQKDVRGVGVTGKGAESIEDGTFVAVIVGEVQVINVEGFGVRVAILGGARGKAQGLRVAGGRVGQRQRHNVVVRVKA